MMKLRDLGRRSGLRVAPVSIGAMRFPRDGRDAISLIRYAIDAGMRYIDTSRGYAESEWLLGRALKDGYRDKVVLSTKCSPWILKPRADDQPDAKTVRRRIEESLIRLDVDYLDYYQVWNIQRPEHFEQATAPGGMVEGIRRAIDDGLVRRTGFTTHDTVENIRRYVKQADWCDLILFTYNLLDRRYEPAIEAAAAQGIGTLVMNPVGGGRLAEPSPVLLGLAAEVGAADVPELAIRYVLSHPAVNTILCGINKLSDIDHSVAVAEKALFSPEQRRKIDFFLDSRTPENTGFCTGCGYCLPCPAGIDIPAVMSCLDKARNWGFRKAAKEQYGKIKGARADACTRCRICERKCTQHLPIVDQLREAAAELG